MKQKIYNRSITIQVIQGEFIDCEVVLVGYQSAI